VHLLAKRNFDVIKMHGTTINIVSFCPVKINDTSQGICIIKLHNVIFCHRPKYSQLEAVFLSSDVDHAQSVAGMIWYCLLGCHEKEFTVA
jgi:Holliday junction resolvasome RuvABC endonuclease subunit